MFALSYFGLVPPKRGSSGTHNHTHTHYMSPQTSSPNVTFMSVALLLASFSIVIYHHITYQMVYGDGSGDDALLLTTGYTATVGRGAEQSLVERPRYGGEDSTQKNKGVAASSVGLFSVVMLSYRSPKSLQHTLRSLCRAKVHEHPLFSEFVVYFQVFEAEEDTKLVQDVLREPVCGKEFSRIRVIGHKSNFPVASATLRAIRNASTEYILYLECDRPVVDVFHSSALVAQQISAGIHMLQAQLADVYRLQLYSSSALDRLQSPLPSDTYGASPRTHCANVLRYNSVFSQSHGVGKGDTLPLLYDEDPEDNSDNDLEAATAVGVKPVGRKPTAGVGICGHKSTVKKTLGNVFYTAYCKHWSKLTKTASSTRGGAPLIAQQDMCDAFCFYQWAVALLTQPPVAVVSDNSEAIASVQKALRKVVQYHSIPEPVSSRRLPIASLKSVDEDEEEATKLSSNSGGNHHHRHHHHGNVSVLCLDSSWCNWSNQPSMYKKDWYLKNIGGPCEDTPEGRGFCIGSPGRQSAVRQELFFVKRREHWAKKQHKICISSGAFIHHEVDNRE